MEILTYDTTRFPFREVVQKALGVKDLTQLPDAEEVFNRENDNYSPWHKKFYRNNGEFLNLYREFVREVISPYFGEAIVYQKIPTFRVQLRNNVSVGEFHRDRDYNHPTNGTNFWLPFTDTNEHNSVWVETEEGKADYRAQAVKYGEVLVFDGANLRHGNKLNTSDTTRVSVDFRAMPALSFIPSDKESINTRTRFTIGAYYELL